MKYLGIDYGDERVGLAISDQDERMAFALKTLHRKSLPGKEVFFAALIDVIDEEEAKGVVIGLPLPLNQHENQPEEPLTCRKARNFAARLHRRLNQSLNQSLPGRADSRSDIPIYFVNEALSSSEAETRLEEAGLKGQKLKDKLDAEAAAIILQQFLNLPQEKRIAYEP